LAKNILKAIFAGDDEDGEGAVLDAEAAEGEENGARERPRSLADAWERLAESNRRLNERVAALEEAQQKQTEATAALLETSKRQLDVLNILGKFHEASEKRGREMENQMRGVPDVLRTLPSATREQAERLSEIAARLYEKAQDNTVNALKSAQANHQRAIEDLIDKSIGSSRKLTAWAMILVGVAAAMMLFAWLQLQQA
jgi:septation ring formation regulator EzrA